MSIEIADNFKYKGKLPNFARDNFLTLDEMVNCSENDFDNGHISYCEETRKHYVFNRNNTVDEELGLWRLLSNDPTEVTELIKSKADKIELDKKVDKVNGYSLVNDELIRKIDELENYDDSKITEDIEQIKTKLDVKVDNSTLTTHTNNKLIHITDEERQAWNNKVSPEDGKGLSSNDFTNEYKRKLDELENYDDEEVTRSIAEINNSLAQKISVQTFTGHADNNDIHITANERTKWNNKIDQTALNGYATKTYVTDEIAKAATSGTIDLTGYAKTADLNAHTSDNSIHITSAERDKWNEVDEKLSIQQAVGDAGKILKVGNDGNIEFVDGENSADNVSYKNSNYPSWTSVKKALDGIMAKVDYIKPEITSFTSTAQAVYEVGQKVSNIIFNWTTNKDVTTQTLTDCPLADANVRTATYTNDITSNKIFTLTIGDGQNTTSKNISISFRNKIYYGSSAIPTDFDSAFILGLSNKQFATGKSGSFDITVGSNEYGFIAFPSSFGTLSSVKIGGFDTDVISCGTISFTNASGGTTNYNIYRTGRHSLGAITMVIN